MKTQPAAFRTALGIALLLCLFTGSASASMVFGAGDEVLLSDLEADDAAIVIHGQEFTDFQYTAGVNAPSSEEIVVEGVLNGDDSVTLVFNVAFTAGVLDPSLIDGSLRFSANIIKDGYVYDRAELTGTLEVPTTSDNSGVASIGETIVANPGSESFGLIIENNVLNGVQGPASLFDSVTFADDSAFTTLSVTKDILVQAGPDNFDRARLTTFTQTFGKRPTGEIPEPTAVALAVLGCLAAVGRRR